MAETLRYLLDTNVISEWAKPDPHPAVVQRLQAQWSCCAISAPALEELQFGCARMPIGRRRKTVQDFIDGVASRMPVLPFDGRAAVWLAWERARLAAAGRVMPRIDGAIAGVAAVNGLVLVTRNLKDFEGYRGLVSENWFESND
jgi:tRNA(fMet)-specific endonuclease VapC